MGRWQPKTGGQVNITAEMEDEEYVKITIVDDGAGIDPADLPTIFDRFYRTDQFRDRRTGGAGLGLAIARAIIEAHDGTIDITSGGIGRGTTVYLEVPIR